MRHFRSVATETRTSLRYVAAVERSWPEVGPGTRIGWSGFPLWPPSLVLLFDGITQLSDFDAQGVDGLFEHGKQTTDSIREVRLNKDAPNDLLNPSLPFHRLPSSRHRIVHEPHRFLWDRLASSVDLASIWPRK